MARVVGQGSSSSTTRKRRARNKVDEDDLLDSQESDSGNEAIPANRYQPSKSKSTRNSRSQRHSLRSRAATNSRRASTSSNNNDELTDSPSDEITSVDESPDSEQERISNNVDSHSRRNTRSAVNRLSRVSRARKNSSLNKPVSADDRASYYFLKDLNVKAWNHAEAIARFRYLLGLGDLFRKFVDYKAQNDSDFRAVLEQANRENQASARAIGRSQGKGRSKKAGRSRATDFTEVEELMDEADDDQKITVFSESPGFIHGELRQYQIDGLNWLISLFLNKINGILADEMGLGKTLQCIAFLAYLRYIQNISGPHLVIVPKSTVQNWAREFEKWTPEVEVLVLSGDKEERANLIKSKLMKCQFDVCITSFELVIREKSTLQKFAWQYVIVDEAHRIKNEQSILSKIMRVLFSRHRLLITGTPLQNNLHELWALLNFLLPDVFSDADVFDEWFIRDNNEEEEEEEEEEEGEDEEEDEEEDNEDEEEDSESEKGSKEVAKNNKKKASPDDNENEAIKSSGIGGTQDEMIEQLRSLLSPFLMRRVKRDVEHTLLPKKEINLYVGMTNMQIEWYQKLLEKDLDAVNNTNKTGGTREGKMRLLNVVMQLRKCCNHPYLFEGAEPGPPFTTDEHLVYNSGKMILLDKLLSRLKAQGSRVLIFSQMGRMLDILEDYCSLRDYEYCRIDGTTVHEDRISAIDEFNKPDSTKFLFLLTTRAGGLGINLTTADQVIIYDSDWNPQADLQAMDRAHRIGQTKQVWVYRFVTEHAIEEKVLERAAHKLRLDQLVIQGGSSRNSAQEKAKAAASKEELANMIRHGAQEVFDQKNAKATPDISIDDIISKGEERTKELNDKYSGLGFDELRKFTLDKPPTGQTPIVNRNQKSAGQEEFRHHHRRARNTLYHDEALIQEAERDGRGSKATPLRAPKQLPLHDFQFFPKELHELQKRELAWYRKVAGIRLSAEDFSSDEEDESEFQNAEIENAKPLSEEEQAQKEALVKEGFPNFSKRDFYHFLNLVIKYGGTKDFSEQALDDMCKEWPEKPAEDIKRYYKVFFDRYKEIADYERYMNLLEAGENKQKKINHRKELLKRKVEETPTPLSTMSITQPSGGSATRLRFSEANDRFLLVQMHRFGLDSPNIFEKIRDSIRDCGLFDFDWYFMSRTATEIGRRCSSLLNIISKEMDGPNNSGRGSKRKGRPPSATKDGNSGKRARQSPAPLQ